MIGVMAGICSWEKVGERNHKPFQKLDGIFLVSGGGWPFHQPIFPPSESSPTSLSRSVPSPCPIVYPNDILVIGTFMSEKETKTLCWE